MIVVTGGAGFIGSNLVAELNRAGEREILVVDNLKPQPGATGAKFRNLEGLQFSDFMDKGEFRKALHAASLGYGPAGLRGVRAILHQGGCSNSLEDDGRYMMDNNFTYSKELLAFAAERQVPFVYASTAAVYGPSENFAPEPANERPLNVYGFSKLAFDNFVRHRFVVAPPASTVVGLRYFNAYGPREQHKGRMASVVYHFARQLRETGSIRLFAGSGGFADGEQRRDFVFVRDLCRINLFFAGLLPESPEAPVHAVVNAGTGVACTFNAVAAAVMDVLGEGKIEFVPMPDDVHGRYQNYTQADLSGLRAAGYNGPFTPLDAGVRETFADSALHA